MQENKYLDESLPISERAADLVDKMTLEEAANQLRYDAPPVDRLGVKGYNWWNEALHGVARCGMATVFPQAIALASAFDPALVFSVAEAVSYEGRAKYNVFQREKDYGIFKGLTYWSPNVNIFRDPRWGRGQETYGEDPFLSGMLGAAFVRGLQGAQEHPPYLRAAACAKHFAVHSGPEKLRHEFDARVSQKDLEETYLPAFKALADAGVEGFMGAYNRTNGEPCCASPALQHILHDRWGWNGYFTSDCWAIADFHMHHMVTATAPESAALALNNGCQLNCGNTYLNLLLACQEGLVSEKTIFDSAKKLMETRIKLGMFNKHTPWDDISYDTVDQKKHRELNLRAAEESLVLLKNNGLLPLDEKKLRTVAVIGPNADSQTPLNGNYHGTANKYVTVLEGIRSLLPQARVLYSRGCHLYRDVLESPGYYGDCYSEAVNHARLADVAILCVGMDETIEGEEMVDNKEWTGDKTDLLLPRIQRDLIRRVLDTGTPCVIVNMTGSAIDLEEANQKADAIVQAFYPGALGGEAIARLLLGRFNPAGRLPVTFYHNTDPLPEFTDYSMANRTYRYIHYAPLYPFGFGLGYSSFAFKNARARVDEQAGTVLLTVEASNTGKMEGDVPVQVYACHHSTAVATPVRFLCGLGRAHLAPGECKTVQLSVSLASLTTVLENGTRVLEKGTYQFSLGTSQPDEASRMLGAPSCAQVEISL